MTNPEADYAAERVVRVHQRIIWIAGNAYQLSNIARVSSIAFRPTMGAIVAKIFGLGFWILALYVLDRQDAIQEALRTFGFILGVVGIFYNIAKLVELYWDSKIHYLIIDSAGAPKAVLASRDYDVIYDLVAFIAEKMENPPEGTELKVLDPRTLLSQRKIYAFNKYGPSVGEREIRPHR